MQKLKLLTILLLSVPLAAEAYVGPGLGLGAIAVIVGILISILIAVIAIIWYPIKRRLVARSKASNENADS